MNATSTTMGTPVAFKRLANPSLGKMLQPERSATATLQVPYLKAGHVQWNGVNLPEDLPLMWASDADIRELTPESGDLLICEGGEVGRAALAPTGLPENTIIQNSLHLVRETDRACPRYLKYALEHVAASGWIDLVCNKATIANLTVDKLRELPVPFWGKSEQEHIANFLDEQTARIDALIAEKETLRTAVQELFAARLGTAVVQGLVKGRRYVPAANKGFEYVPEDWNLVPLKHLATSSGGMTPSKDNDAFWAGEIPWVSPKDMKRFVLHDSTDHISQAALDSTSLKLNPVDSVLVVVRGMILAHTFPVAMNAVPVTINQDMKALRPNARISPKYLAWMLRGLQPLILSLTEESAHGTKALRTDQWANQCVPVPPPREQVALVTAFESWDGESAALVSHLAEHIDRLREYRSSLISAAVTGGININH